MSGVRIDSKRQRRQRVALLSMPITDGGVYNLVSFLYRFLQAQPGLEPYIVWHLDQRVAPELSICWRSIRRLFPRLWRLGVGVGSFKHDGCLVVGVGAVFPEWEPMRYLSHRRWQEVLAEFDMIIVVGGSIFAGLPAAAGASKYVLWVGTPYWEDRTQRLRQSGPLRRLNFLVTKPALDAIERAVASRASMLMYQSQYTAERLRKRYHVPEERMRYVGCPVADPLFREDQTPSGKRGGVRLVSVGRFTDPRKNLPLLMEAFHLAYRRCDTLRLTVVGAYDEEQVEHLKQKFPGAASATFVGFVSDEEKREELWRSDIFVLPSQQEGLGIVVLEAMAAALPVISTDCGGPRSLIENGKSGVLVPNGDPTSLANAIVRLAQSPRLCRSMGQQGQRRARRHSETLIGAQLLQVLQHVYANQPTPRSISNNTLDK